MHDHGIARSLDGHECPRCGVAYPSLHWFKRDAYSGEAMCVECAEGFQHGSLTDLVPPGRAGVNPLSPRALVEVALHFCTLILYRVKRDEIRAAAARLDGLLGGHLAEVLITIWLVLIAVRLFWRIYELVTGHPPRLRQWLTGDTGVP